MEQVFDWLREQICKDFRTIPLQNNRGVKFKAIDVKDVENIINEAEAKLESECCEQKWNSEDQWYNTSCGHILAPHCYNFCPYCGKRIKMLEVE